MGEPVSLAQSTSSLHISCNICYARRIQVNHLGTALVSLLLLPLLEKTGREFNTEPRLVIVSSDRHFHATVADDVIAMPKILETLSSKDYCTRSYANVRISCI